MLRQEQLVEAYQGRGVFIIDHSAPSGPSQDNARQDPAIESLRSDLERLAERVARIERIIADGPDSEGKPP